MIEALIINSFVIFGVYTSTRDGMIFGFVAKFVTKALIRVFLWSYGDGKTVGYKPYDGGSMKFPIIIDATEKAVASTSFITKPLFDCPPCMASLWGLPFAALNPLSWWTVVYLLALCGLNYVVMKLINR